MWRYLYFRGFRYTPGGCGNVCSGCSVSAGGWERLARWETMIIQCSAFKSIECGTQFYGSSRQAFGLSSKFCTVQVLFKLGTYLVYKIRVSVFQGFWLYTNMCKCIFCAPNNVLATTAEFVRPNLTIFITGLPLTATVTVKHRVRELIEKV